MPARKWTSEQKARQALLIRKWEPWKQATGPRTAQGKAVSSKNAINYSIRELLRDVARTNRAMIAFIEGRSPAPTFDHAARDKLIENVEIAINR